MLIKKNVKYFNVVFVSLFSDEVCYQYHDYRETLCNIERNRVQEANYFNEN